MSIPAKLDTIIETKINKMKKNEILRPGRSYNSFTNDFTSILAQAEEDKEILTATGFDFSVMKEYKAILEKMVLIYSERVTEEDSIEEAVKQFREEMPKAKEHKKLLSAVLRFIIARTDSEEIKKVYDIIRKGSCQIDTLNDILVMVNIIRKYLDLASLVRPGGKTIDEPYLEEVHEQALNLVALKGQADMYAHDPNENVDRLNKIISLAISAEREIKLFAELAFYDDIERYNRDYASSSLRHKNNTHRNKTEDVELELN